MLFGYIMYPILIWFAVICVSIVNVFLGVTLSKYHNYLKDKWSFHFHGEHDAYDGKHTFLDIIGHYFGFLRKEQYYLGLPTAVKNFPDQLKSGSSVIRNYLQTFMEIIADDYATMQGASTATMHEDPRFPIFTQKFDEYIARRNRKNPNKTKEECFSQICADMAIFDVEINDQRFSDVCRSLRKSEADFADVQGMNNWLRLPENIYHHNDDVSLWKLHYPDQSLAKAMKSFDLNVFNHFLKK